jgi:hypothetical protein
MSDVTVIQDEPEAAPAQLPADAPAPSDDLDSLLAEFDQRTAQLPAEPAVDDLNWDVSAEHVPPASDVDKFFADLDTGAKISGLEGQLNELRTAEYRRQELAAFNEFVDDLDRQVSQVAPHLPEGWSKLKVESLAHWDPDARLAFETRNIDPKAANLDLQHVRFALKQATDPKQIAELTKLAHQLDVASRSASILRQVKNQIISEAKKLQPPIDPEATADRDAVAAAVREAMSGDIPEKPVNLGTMSDREFGEYTRKNFGF